MVLIKSFIGSTPSEAYPRSIGVSKVVFALGGVLRKVPVLEIPFAPNAVFGCKFCQIHHTRSIIEW